MKRSKSLTSASNTKRTIKGKLVVPYHERQRLLRRYLFITDHYPYVQRAEIAERLNISRSFLATIIKEYRTGLLKISENNNACQQQN